MDTSTSDLPHENDVLLKIPLAKYEKDLIDNFVTTFDWIHSPTKVVGSPAFVFVFTHWTWTRRYYDALINILTDDDWTKYHQGRPKEMWSSVKRVLPHETTVTDSFRLDELEAANANTIISFGRTEELKLMPVPREEDLRFWATLTELVEFYKKSEPVFLDPNLSAPGDTTQKGRLTTFDFLSKLASDPVILADTEEAGKRDGLREEDLERLRVDEWTFEIWSILRACATILRRETTSLQKSKEGLRHTSFYELHDPVQNGHVRNSKTRSGVQASSSGYQITNKGLRIISFGEEPSKFVEYIPWNQLNKVNLPDLTHEFGEQELVVWKPEKLMSWERHLFTEDNVFRACVETHTTFPNYNLPTGILFLLTPIKDFTLETGANGGFWGHWNDCAVSHNPVTDEWYLLQTVAGFRFRRLYRETNRQAALKYFGSLIAQGLCGRTTSLEDALGLDFKPQYVNLLTLIPFEQITTVDPLPLGEGARGIVFRATWTQHKALNTKGNESFEVALKSIKVHGAEDIKRFIVELDNMFTAVVGSSVRVVGLHGITKTPSKQMMQSSHSPQNLPCDTIFLVLEYATLGTFSSYLRDRLTGQDADWPLLIDAMGDIAHGIYELHRKKIFHRDIHWNNILVGSHTYEADAGPLVPQDVILIGDLGEAQIFTGQLQGRTYYGNPDFWAPEVKKHKRYSFASDVYAMGCLFYQMLLLQWEMAQNVADVNLQHNVPRAVIELIYTSLQADPNTRPEALEVLQVLEDLDIDIEMSYRENEEKLEMVSLTETQLNNLLKHCHSEDTHTSPGSMDEIPE